MPTRREVLKLAAVGAGAYLSSRVVPWTRVRAQVEGGTLPPDVIPKFVSPLLIPPAMPLSARSETADFYTLAVRQFHQQILPPPHRPTTVWGYGSVTNPATFNSPSYTIEAKPNRPVVATWVNQLVDGRGRYLPHLLPVDQTLHWANPPGGVTGRDRRGADPQPYSGPVPIVTHLHGGHTTDESDGYPEAWYLPAATNIPPGFATTGTWYQVLPRQIRGDLGGHLDARQRHFHLRQRPAASHALVSRPHVGDDTAERLCGARRLLPAARRFRRFAAWSAAGASSSRRRPGWHELLRNSDCDPGSLVQRRWIPVLPEQSRVLRGPRRGPAPDSVHPRGRLQRRERRVANLESRVLRKHDDGERPDLAVSRG